MNFSTEWPTESGWYWFIDTEYPQPMIGYVMPAKLYHGQNEYTRVLCQPGRPGIRIGDQIIPPPCTDVVVKD